MSSVKSYAIQEELERKILHGLACEWENALWVLNPAHRAALKKPLFSIGEMKGQLGSWTSQKQEICLSRKLVYHHAWRTVRETLLHEMAHQFADQVLGAGDERAHGPAFYEACFLLRANPRAAAEYDALEDPGNDLFRTESDRIMLRVKKLLALAQSKNRHEAEAAMLKAHQLIKKYNIDLLASEQKRNFSSIFLGAPALRHFREKYHLAHLIQDFYFVQGIWVSAYVVAKGKMGRVLEISGTSGNIQIASYVYDFVSHFVDRRWQQYNHAGKLNRHRKTDFAIGIIEGFRARLESESGSHKLRPDRHALVKVEDPLLTDYMRYRYPRTVSFGRGASSHDPAVFEDGRRIGRKLVLYKGISEKSYSTKLLTD